MSEVMNEVSIWNNYDPNEKEMELAFPTSLFARRGNNLCRSKTGDYYANLPMKEGISSRRGDGKRLISIYFKPETIIKTEGGITRAIAQCQSNNLSCVDFDQLNKLCESAEEKTRECIRLTIPTADLKDNPPNKLKQETCYFPVPLKEEVNGAKIGFICVEKKNVHDWKDGKSYVWVELGSSKVKELLKVLDWEAMEKRIGGPMISPMTESEKIKQLGGSMVLLRARHPDYPFAITLLRREGTRKKAVVFRTTEDALTYVERYRIKEQSSCIFKPFVFETTRERKSLEPEDCEAFSEQEEILFGWDLPDIEAYEDFEQGEYAFAIAVADGHEYEWELLIRDENYNVLLFDTKEEAVAYMDNNVVKGRSGQGVVVRAFKKEELDDWPEFMLISLDSVNGIIYEDLKETETGIYFRYEIEDRHDSKRNCKGLIGNQYRGFYLEDLFIHATESVIAAISTLGFDEDGSLDERISRILDVDFVRRSVSFSSKAKCSDDKTEKEEADMKKSSFFSLKCYERERFVIDVKGYIDESDPSGRKQEFNIKYAFIDCFGEILSARQFANRFGCLSDSGKVPAEEMKRILQNCEEGALGELMTKAELKEFLSRKCVKSYLNN